MSGWFRGPDHGLSVEQLRTANTVHSIASDSMRRTSALSNTAASAQKESRYHVQAGNALRQQSEARRSRASEEGLSIKQKSDEAIRERVKNTQAQKQALQDVLRDVLERLEGLERIDEGLDELLGLEAEVVEKLREAIRERRTRPQRHSKEEVDFWLKALQNELEASLFPKYHSDLKKVRHALKRMSPELTHSIEDKADAVIVDLECLAMDSSTPHPAPPSRGSPGSSRGSALEPSSTRKQQALTHTLQQRATLQAQQALSLEHKLVGYSSRRLEAEAGAALLQAYSQRVQGGEEGLDQLHATLQQVEQDLDSCHDELNELSECIAHQSSALQVTQGRMRARQSRPTSERVRDLADRALEEEEDALMKHITALHVQQKKLKNNRQRLGLAAQQLQNELNNKQAGLGADQQAQQLFEILVQELQQLIQPLSN